MNGDKMTPRAEQGFIFVKDRKGGSASKHYIERTAKKKQIHARIR